MSLFKKTKKDESGQVSDEKVVGIFKAIIEVKSKKDEQELLTEKERLEDEERYKLIFGTKDFQFKKRPSLATTIPT